MSNFEDVQKAQKRLESTRYDFVAIQKTFRGDDEAPYPKIGRYSMVDIPEHLLKPFGVLLLDYFEREVADAEKNLESVAHALSAAE